MMFGQSCEPRRRTLVLKPCLLPALIGMIFYIIQRTTASSRTLRHLSLGLENGNQVALVHSIADIDATGYHRRNHSCNWVYFTISLQRRQWHHPRALVQHHAWRSFPLCMAQQSPWPSSYHL
ncbi:hypothetical protein NEOLEDRAFT_953346 [Neolentinus lepideus HHB14362 ss-1]|uniref:Uncharacterized protein n=1 Tax=Neolentinus lepideus HHB14362 ss-1 TaxID=1314782 RepID=A0A165UEU5_9AGAM|nr:hypothetical protein NEOLEDRAFT_953346 [Neolentinus lepideus HHB14362 ss-1]